jgi:hypothetical protein
MLVALDNQLKQGRDTTMGATKNSYLEFRARNIARHQGRLLSLDLVDKEIADKTVKDAWDLSYSAGDMDWLEFDRSITLRHNTGGSNPHGQQEDIARRHGRLLSLDLGDKEIAEDMDWLEFDKSITLRHNTGSSNPNGQQEDDADDNEESEKGDTVQTSERGNTASARNGTKQGND